MIDHIELLTQKFRESITFYSDVLAPLGYKLEVDGLSKGFGDGQTLDFFITEGEPTKNIHYAFGAKNRSLVDAVYEAARDANHTLDRPPALAPHIHPNYYAGYLRDPNGHLVEVVCHAVV
jgi:catechol 2,3-dioxygenase-like lactoylglutathione lyase family enzyme